MHIPEGVLYSEDSEGEGVVPEGDIIITTGGRMQVAGEGEILIALF